MATEQELKEIEEECREHGYSEDRIHEVLAAHKTSILNKKVYWR